MKLTAGKETIAWAWKGGWNGYRFLPPPPPPFMCPAGSMGGGGGERNKNFLKHFQKMLAKFFFPNRNVIYALKKSKYKF
jgi:hypothetical protein